MLTGLTIQEIFLRNIESGDYSGINFIDEEGNIEYMSYKKLYMEARYRLHDLQQKGLQPGDELVFQFMSDKNLLVTFWACIFGKIIPVPIVFGVTADIMNKITKVWKKLNNPWLITDLPTLKKSWEDSLKEKDDKIIDVEARFLLFENIVHTKQATPLPANPTDLAFIQFSSGSTGYPKGVKNTQESIVYNAGTMSQLIDLEPSDKFLGWMPLTHDLGLVFFHIFPLLANKPQFLMSPMVFYAYPNLWLKCLAKHEITISGSPNFGYRHVMDNLNEQEIQGLSFKNLRVMISGAEPVSILCCRDFEKKFSPYGLPKRIISPSYGLAEAVLGVSFFKMRENITREVIVNRHKLKIGDSIEFAEANSSDAVSFACLGGYIGTEIKITDSNGQTLPENSLGLIHLKSKAITAGYYNDEEATQKVVDKEGWLNTGDLGFISNSRLVITGREKEMILINGQNYFPADIDEILEELPGIGFQQAVSCNSFNEQKYQDEILIFLIYKGSAQEFLAMEELIKKHVGERTGLWIKKVIAVDRLAKTTSGKIQRYLLLQEYAAGKYDTFNKETAITNDNEKAAFKGSSVKQIEDKILELIKVLFGITNFTNTDNFFDFGLTSLQLMRLKNSIDNFLYKELDDVALFKYTNVKELATYIYEDILKTNTVPGPKSEDISFSENRMRRFVKPSNSSANQ